MEFCFEMIGLHLMIDGITIDKVSQETIRNILIDMPKIIDMTILNGPHIVKGVPENPGYTGVEIIDKSHISIHTFSDNNIISIDVYSCKPFNAKKVIDYLKTILTFKNLNTRTIIREISDNITDLSE